MNFMASSKTSNPNYIDDEYSIWDRMCQEEFFSMNNKLEERHSEAMPEVVEAIVGINAKSEYFDELLQIKDSDVKAQ